MRMQSRRGRHYYLLTVTQFIVSIILFITMASPRGRLRVHVVMPSITRGAAGRVTVAVTVTSTDKDNIKLTLTVTLTTLQPAIVNTVVPPLRGRLTAPHQTEVAGRVELATTAVGGVGCERGTPVTQQAAEVPGIATVNVRRVVEAGVAAVIVIPQRRSLQPLHDEAEQEEPCGVGHGAEGGSGGLSPV